MGMRVSAAPLLLAVGIGAAVVACGGESFSPEGSPRPTLTLIPELETPRPTTLFDRALGSQATREFIELTEEAIRNDPSIARLVGGSPIVGIRTSMWFWGDDPETGRSLVVATIAQVTLGQPVSHERVELPTAGRRSDFYHLWPDELQSRYDFFRHSTVEWHLKNITEFEATVDFYKGEVVGYLFLPSGDEVAEALVDYPDPGELSELYSEQGADLTREIVERDDALAELLDGAGDVSVFTIRLGEHRFGMLRAWWDMSVTVAGDYAVFVDRDSETWDYRSVIVPMNETNTRQLTVYVDLAREKIISVEPDEGD